MKKAAKKVMQGLAKAKMKERLKKMGLDATGAKMKTHDAGGGGGAAPEGGERGSTLAKLGAMFGGLGKNIKAKHADAAANATQDGEDARSPNAPAGRSFKELSAVRRPVSRMKGDTARPPLPSAPPSVPSSEGQGAKDVIVRQDSVLLHPDSVPRPAAPPPGM